ncbi:Apical endosomal glycoprotein, partial [Chaetura pelagica]
GDFIPIVSPVAVTVLPSWSMVVNSCSSAAEQLCDFVCNCSDCSDENQCGYLQGSVVLGTPFTCDFEEGDCGWRDVSTSAHRWVRGRASLAAWGAGPHSDHTVGTDLGWFMVTVSPPAKTTATAWLRSQVMREAAATCEIRAWYHLSGSGLNQMEQPVLRLAMVHRDEVVELWQSPRNQGEGWHQLVTYLGRVPGQFQLIFSLTQLPACEAEVALDDIIFRNCGLQEPGQPLCRGEQNHCGQGSCLARSRFCDGTEDCGDGSDEDAARCKPFTRCSFEQGFCNWETEVGQPAWERNTSLSLGTGGSVPTRDHSHNSRAGFFLLVGSTSTTGTTGPARLSSPTFQATNSCSLVLYCHLHGSATSSLSISYVTRSTKHLMRERTGDLGSCWVRERVNFNVTESFKVLIEGVASGTGTVAIDDLILSPGCMQEQGELEGGCPQPLLQNRQLFPEKPSLSLPSWTGAGHCTGEEVACDSGGCISTELSCDFAQTCADGSDEQRCGATTFEAGAGGWHDVSVGRLRWGVKRDTEPTQPTAMFITGAFLALQAGEGQMVAAAKARTPLLGPSGPACTLEMSYRIRLGPQELSCNFERGMCGWYQDQSSDFRWVHGTEQGQGPDHTTGSGYFMAVDPSAPCSRRQRAQLITYSQEPTTAPRCLSFWYRLAGPQIGTLNLKLWLEGAEDTVLWTQRGTRGSLWHRGQATLPSTGRRRYRVAFEALRDGFQGDMALDDLALTAGPCGAEPSCSFEVDECGLAGSGWRRQSNGTGSTAGPRADHSTGTSTGHYMVVSTGRGSLPVGQVAALTSQLYQPSATTQCLAFWYQLSAQTPGSLGVFVEQNMVRRKVMSVSTMEGDSWHRGHVTVQPDGDWQVIFEAVGAGVDHGYIALDDLHVSEGACPEPGSCDFERDTCGWSSPPDPHLHGFAWGWKSGIPLAKYPSPEQDHTLGTRDGHYMHFDTSVLGPGGTTARLESQHLPAAANSCLRFWYHMDIPEHLSCGELRVLVQGPAGRRTVWSVPGHQSRGWQGAVVPTQSPSEFQLIFEISTQRWPMEGTVALDDIVYSTGRGCHSIPEASVEEKSSSSFTVEVVLSVLLATTVLVLVAAGGWYWLGGRGLASGSPAESNVPQGFDNITFRD